MTFLLPFPHTFVFLITGWGWILNGETAGVWPKLLPSPSLYTSLSPVCSHILNPASHSLPPVCQVPGTIGSHLRLDGRTVQCRPADKPPGSCPVYNVLVQLGTWPGCFWSLDASLTSPLASSCQPSQQACLDSFLEQCRRFHSWGHSL